MDKYTIEFVKTEPFNDQNPGTSGLRKKCRIFTQKNYLENFLQSIFENIPEEDRKKRTLLVGGDGRFFCVEAARKVIQMAAANKFKKVIVCQNSLASTPALSFLIVEYQAIGGIILTASHNPGGIDEDFGVKFNVDTGGGAPQSLTDKIFSTSKSIKQYKICKDLTANIDDISNQTFKIVSEGIESIFEVEVINSVADYVDYLQTIFNFDSIKNFIEQGVEGPLKMLLDCRNGIAGIYVYEIICQRMGLSEELLANFVPKTDFGGLHPDPNPTYAADFIDTMKERKCEFGAAFDGDADRCMIVGRDGYYVSPSDSVAIISANAVTSIPFFNKRGCLNGVARSMPTSSALDKVAEYLSLEYGKEVKCYEVPTGWKFFCNLMDAEKVDICGEESYGAGSVHLREKDGIWVCLAWLSIMVQCKKYVNAIISDHWRKFGRHYYTRYDYENLTTEQGNLVFTSTEELIKNGFGGKIFQMYGKEMIIKSSDNFNYHDPVDGSVASNQGLRIIFENGDRIILRLSGTGSEGSTVRIYIEHYEKDADKIFNDKQENLKDLIDIALELTNIEKITGRNKPTVIT